MSREKSWNVPVLVFIFCQAIDIVLGRPAHQTRILTKLTANSGKGFFGPEQTKDQAIIFPDSFDVIFEPVPRIDGPPKCAGDLTFCEDFESYPYTQVQKVIEKNDVIKDLFGVDEDPKDEIANRIGFEEEKFLCRSVIKTIYPQLGKTIENKWKIIVNQGKQAQYVQGVRVETCKRPESSCEVLGSLPDGITTSCVQKYTYRRLLAFDEGNKPTYETFRLPSACCCAYKTDNNFLARFGAAPTTRARR